MKVEILNAIDEEFLMCPEAFGGPLTIEEVNQAEYELKVRLPEDF
ncbi:hypothetical protein [Bacillus sp. CMF12]|nr:hypothetical protein [Bacillus sp. CMF12]